MTMATSSTNFAARGSCQAPGKSVRHPSMLDGVKRANAEHWFNDSNKNATHPPHAPFFDSELPTFPLIGGAKPFQMILRSIYMTRPHQAWTVPVQFNRTSTPKAR